jgi:putative DNA primase/helicase
MKMKADPTEQPDPIEEYDRDFDRRHNGKATATFSDDALALQFSDEHAGTLRYVALWNKWYRWTGTFWEQDTTLLAFDLVRDLCRRLARAANEGGKSLSSNHTVAAVANLARADRRHAAVIEQWDTNLWLLNTPDGPLISRPARSALTIQATTSPSVPRLPLAGTVPGGAPFSPRSRRGIKLLGPSYSA